MTVRFLKYFLFLYSISISLTIFGQDLPGDYQSKTACEKSQIVWGEISKTEYEKGSLPALDGTGWDNIFQAAIKPVKKVLSLDFSPTFDHESDLLPEGRVKLIHAYGSVALAEFVADKTVGKSNPFTGLLSKNDPCLLIRLSLGADPDKTSYTPGMAVKFFVDGSSSRNIMVMDNLEGQEDDTNFFKYSFSNDLPKPNSFMFKAIELYFAIFHSTPRHLTVEHLASIDLNGVGVNSDKVNAPYIIEFRPLYTKISSDSIRDFRLELAGIPAGTTLYEVYGKSKDGKKEYKLGILRTKTKFINSRFGDENLFFQHFH